MEVKRSRGEEGDVEMANCLMLLSNSGDQEETSTSANNCNSAGDSGRVFECKTCNRQFPSFQALGGHRASHKRARVGASEEQAPAQPKTHECPICGIEFTMGQALGGHMRRHRAELKTSTYTSNDNIVHRPHHLSLDLNLLPLDHAHQSIDKKMLPVLSSGTKKIGGLSEKNSGGGGLENELGVFLGLGMVGKVPLVH